MYILFYCVFADVTINHFPFFFVIPQSPDSSRFSIGCMYVSLSVLDIFAIYHEIRSVVFTLLNYERASIVIDDFVTACGKLPCSKSSPLKVSMREHVFLPSRNIPNIFRTVCHLLLLLSCHPIRYCSASALLLLLWFIQRMHAPVVVQ